MRYDNYAWVRSYCFRLCSRDNVNGQGKGLSRVRDTALGLVFQGYFGNFFQS